MTLIIKSLTPSLSRIATQLKASFEVQMLRNGDDETKAKKPKKRPAPQNEQKIIDPASKKPDPVKTIWTGHDETQQTEQNPQQNVQPVWRPFNQPARKGMTVQEIFTGQPAIQEAPQQPVPNVATPSQQIPQI